MKSLLITIPNHPIYSVVLAKRAYVHLGLFWHMVINHQIRILGLVLGFVCTFIPVFHFISSKIIEGFEMILFRYFMPWLSCFAIWLLSTAKHNKAAAETTPVTKNGTTGTYIVIVKLKHVVQKYKLVGWLQSQSQSSPRSEAASLCNQQDNARVPIFYLYICPAPVGVLANCDIQKVRITSIMSTNQQNSKQLLWPYPSSYLIVYKYCKKTDVNG